MNNRTAKKWLLTVAIISLGLFVQSQSTEAKSKPKPNGGGKSSGSTTGGGGTPAGSDIRLKRDILEIATLSNGLRLYRFRYKGGSQTYVGVMAQEVLKVFPDAVTQGADGYYRVYYGRLGLHMQTWKQWFAANRAASTVLDKHAPSSDFSL